MNHPKQNTRAALRAYRDDTARPEPWWGGAPVALFTAQVIAGICVTAAAITFFGLLYNGGHEPREILGGVICVGILATMGAAAFGSWAYQCGRDSHRREVNRALTQIINIRPEFYDDLSDEDRIEAEADAIATDRR